MFATIHDHEPELYNMLKKIKSYYTMKQRMLS